VRSLQSPEPTYLIVLTSREGKENIVKALQSGADDYVTKPFHREELRARLQVGLRIVGLQTSQAVAFAFARAVEAKSPYTQGHSQRVMEYSLLLGQRLGLPHAQMEVLRQGALLHDIGKIGIPDSILEKTGALTPEEFEIIKRHPAQGAQMVEPMHSISEVIPLIRWHHERMDGRGYPDGLEGDEIPPLTRLLSVADVYDALASARPYRDPIPHEDCIRLLRESAINGGLDPYYVTAFADAFTTAAPGPEHPGRRPPDRAFEHDIMATA
jgi:putative two-component system response regulator